ncbi:MAG: hypothetical protein JNJ54_00905 [Myxococcaceae bacterium]|nr:hypothetical protein [Myxococcaceae bacterium]
MPQTDRSLERMANGVVITASVVLLLLIWPLTNSVVARWREQLAEVMGPTPFAAPAEFALSEGRVLLSAVALLAAAVAASGFATGRPGVTAPAIAALVLLIASGLWAIAFSTVW